MRNAKQQILKRYASGIFLLGPYIVLCSCATRPPAELSAAETQMSARDFNGVQKSADAVIAKNPTGPDAAKAYYLKGQAIYQISSDNAADARERLQQARLAFIAALQADADHGALEGYIRAAISNVSYWQEDYTTAAQQGLAAGPLLTDPVTAGWTYYRAGLSQQRLGQFAAADAAFAQAIVRAPGTDPAIRAQAHRGEHAFTIRILFDRPAAAASAAAALAKKGMPVARHDKTAGAEAELLVGSFSTYAAAISTRTQLLPQYPNAAVVP